MINVSAAKHDGMPILSRGVMKCMFQFVSGWRGDRHQHLKSDSGHLLCHTLGPNFLAESAMKYSNEFESNSEESHGKKCVSCEELNPFLIMESVHCISVISFVTDPTTPSNGLTEMAASEAGELHKPETSI